MKTIIVAVVFSLTSVSSIAAGSKSSDFLSLEDGVFLDKTSRQVNGDGLKTMNTYEFPRQGNILVTTYGANCKDKNLAILRQAEYQDKEVVSDRELMIWHRKKELQSLGLTIFDQICK